MKMQRRARGAKWGALVSVVWFAEEADRTPSSCNKAASAAMPRPLAELVKKARRVARFGWTGRKRVMTAFQQDELRQHFQTAAILARRIPRGSAESERRS